MKINFKHSLFQTESFLKDSVLYSNLFSIYKNNPSTEIISDEENYMIIKSGLGANIWIWSKDDLSADKSIELLNELKQIIPKDIKVQLTAKEHVFHCIFNIYEKEISRMFFNDKIGYQKIIAYQKDTDECIRKKGYLGKLKINDIELILKYISEYYLIQEKIDFNTEDIRDLITMKINNKSIYCWRNIFDEVVSIASLNDNWKEDSSIYAKLNMIFTLPNHRNKGYCKVLLSELSNIVQEENKIPILYSDAGNLYANQAFEKIGFTSRGCLFNTTLYIIKK